jgi:homoprotocatechuate degradation regulator HpaR
LAGSLLAARESVMAPIRPFLRAANVTEQQWRVLRVLTDAEFLDAKGIADQALLYPPTVSRILKELVDRKLIQRRIDGLDARRSIVSITPAGKQLVSDTAKHTKLLLGSYRKAFGPKRLEALTAEALALAEALRPFQQDE